MRGGGCHILRQYRHSDVVEVQCVVEDGRIDHFHACRVFLYVVAHFLRWLIRVLLLVEVDSGRLDEGDLTALDRHLDGAVEEFLMKSALSLIGRVSNDNIELLAKIVLVQKMRAALARFLYFALVHLHRLSLHVAVSKVGYVFGGYPVFPNQRVHDFRIVENRHFLSCPASARSGGRMFYERICKRVRHGNVVARGLHGQYSQ